ncbi:MAG: magnesium transporter [Candidatus Odinarchaeota archaeon]
MEIQDSKGKIIKETFPSEIISIVGHIFSGIVLTLLILPFNSFPILLLMIPALLSIRGNLSGPYIARTARDLIIGEFSIRSWIENTLATYFLSLITSFLIGLFTLILNLIIFHITILTIGSIILIPIISTLISSTITIPISTLLNYIAFNRGLNPNNVVPPIMTTVGDFTTLFSFYITLLMLGVP